MRNSDVAELGFACLCKGGGLQEPSEQIAAARKEFPVHYVSDKSYSRDDHRFARCYAGLVTCNIATDGTIGLCVCRRGDPAVKLCHIDDIGKSWLSIFHKHVVEKIDVRQCPGCTNTQINEVWENCVLEDKIGMYFI